MHRIAWIMSVIAALWAAGCASLVGPLRPDDSLAVVSAGAPPAAGLPGGAWPTTGTLTAAPPPPAAPGPLQLTVNDAILLALENNTAFQIDRLQPAISRTFEGEARSAFDPTLSGSIEGSHTRVEANPPGGPDSHTIADTVSGNVGISEFLPTGTTLDLNGSANRSDSTGSPNRDSTRD